MADGGNGMSDVQRNLMLRTALLQTGIPQRKFISTTVGTLGQSTRVKLFNVGITTSLRILVTVPITIAVAIAVASSRGPWNLISRLKISDYDGSDRINLSGFQLYMLNCFRRRQAFGYNNQATAVSAGVVVNPSVPTAIGNGTLQFWLEVPICVNDNRYDGINQDLTGAIYSQTGVGELYLTIDWNTNLYSNANIEAVYSGAGTTTVGLNGVAGPAVSVWQNFIFPQYIGKTIPVPFIDVSSVYELAGNVRTSDNLNANSEKLLSMPNYRKVIGAFVNFVNNGAMGNTDLTLLRIIVNANNILYENNQVGQQIEQRLYMEGDVVAGGAYWWSFRDRPIETTLFGNVQLGITPNAVSGTSYMEYMWESIFLKGAAVPGMNQSG